MEIRSRRHAVSEEVGMKRFSLVAIALFLAGCLSAAPVAAPEQAPAPTVAPAPRSTSAPPTTTVAAAEQTPAPTDGPTASPAPRPTAIPMGPTPRPDPTPQPTLPPPPAVLDPPASEGKFAMDVYLPRAHVRQATNAMCVPASMQIMINLMSGQKPDRSRATQDSLYALARSYSPWITPDRDGASARGWAAGLEQLGYGDFELLSLASMEEALKVGARQMRFTGKPAGLLVWRGDHAWVMSGFKATADPAYTDDFAVTAAWIEDPWYGRTDRTWGKGLAPHTLLTEEELRDDFVSWPSRWFLPVYGSASRFVVVVPLS